MRWRPAFGCISSEGGYKAMSILVDESTTFIIQGITGREAVNLTRDCLAYGPPTAGGGTCRTSPIITPSASSSTRSRCPADTTETAASAASPFEAATEPSGVFAARAPT